MRRSIYFTAAAALASVSLAACSSTKLLAATDQKSPELTSIVTVQQGQLQGVYNKDHTVELYAGIPYAQPPVGDLRWKEPQDPEAWDGIYLADHYASRAMQKPNNWLFDFVANNFFYHNPGGYPSESAPMSEDCLYLNIWKPANADPEQKLPVLVYIHGGSLNSGSSYKGEHTGENLCQDGIIVVTVAYRLGVFGYFAHDQLIQESPNGTTGNYGLLDQIKSLEWVHNNIEAFGGDSSNITIAGESAGSSSINALCVSPLAKGLFRRAIAESSSISMPVPPHTFRTMERAKSVGNNIMQEFNCTSIQELRNIPADKLVKTNFTNSEMTVDGYALVETPWQTYLRGANNEEALLNGFNADEGSAFTMLNKKNAASYNQLLEYYFEEYAQEAMELLPHKTNKDIKEAYSTMFAVYNFTYPHSVWTRLAVSKGIPVYEYYFTKENGGIGTFHSGEIIYAYRNVPKSKYYDSKDRELERIMSSYWVNFVKYGNPNGTDLPEWPLANDTPGQLLELGEEVFMRPVPYQELNDILDKLKLPEGYQF